MRIPAAASLILGTLVVALVLLIRGPGGFSSRPPAIPQKRPPPAATGTMAVMLKKLLEGGEIPKPTAEQLRAFVARQQRSAASLLAAWQLGGDRAWLDEAAERYPDDPRVALAKLGASSEPGGDAEEWIARLKQADPDNSIGWCYDALARFREGSADEGRAALAKAARRGRFDARIGESAAALAEAYRSIGYDDLAAETAGWFGVALPHLQLGRSLQKEALAKLGPQPGEETVRDLLAVANAVRGGSGTGFLVSDLVSSAMERKMLDELSLVELVPGTRKFVMERLAELDAERQTVRDLAAKASPLLPTLDASELQQYLKRVRVDGELKAMQWLLARHREAR